MFSFEYINYITTLLTTIWVEHDFTALRWTTNQEPNISQRRKLKSLVPETFDWNLLPLKLKETLNWIASIKGVVIYRNAGHQGCFPGVGDHRLWHGHHPPSCRFQCPRLWCELSVFKFPLSFLNLLYVELWLVNVIVLLRSPQRNSFAREIRMYILKPQKTTVVMPSESLSEHICKQRMELKMIGCRFLKRPCRNFVRLVESVTVALLKQEKVSISTES